MAFLEVVQGGHGVHFPRIEAGAVVRRNVCDSVSDGTPRLSAREWAGSVENRSSFYPVLPPQQRNAVAAAHVVFPTPPLPPKKR